MADDDITLDTAALRVLAHPMRLALLNRLRRQGPATVRQLATHFALDSGAASYHLRRLAAGGLIEEDTERGTRRDRWWRARHRISTHDPSTSPDAAESRAYVQAVALADSETLRRVAGEVVPVLPDEWFGASAFMSRTLHLTPGELDAMKRELAGVIERFRVREPAEEAETEAEGAEVEGAERVVLQLQMFPLLAEDT
ncbi:winged helix-turn-helix domain-containing protein [Streptomyces sp. NBC_00878]|uniref:winged helix-turn-helix domain-containing protein n=1 Tax=Streptomyces sp. NBC_00878 TaxID=2975854 RepID=UPI002259895E|nr:winged helix-turn-helix domain-containing protein [Streptomyces sp. NBC_00878]MCX4903278.1 winged helix-turn-helix domain-containing protein [Streptomyces sp. NBC_00878]